MVKIQSFWSRATVYMYFIWGARTQFPNCSIQAVCWRKTASWANRQQNYLLEIPERRTQSQIPIHTHRDKSASSHEFQRALHKVQSNLFSNLRHNGVNYGNARAAGGGNWKVDYTPLGRVIVSQNNHHRTRLLMTQLVMYARIQAGFARNCQGTEAGAEPCAIYADDSWHARHQNIAPVTSVAAADRKLLLLSLYCILSRELIHSAFRHWNYGVCSLQNNCIRAMPAYCWC